MKTDLLLIIIYSIFLIIFSFNLLKKIRKSKELNMIIVSDVLFLILFYLTPLYYNICSYNNDSYLNVWDTMFFTNSVKIKYIVLILSIIGYLFLNFGFYLSKKINFKKYNIYDDKNDNTLINNNKDIKKQKKYKVTIIILILIGWICLILWTKVYGGLFGIFKYASKIRSGIIEIYNPFTFLKYFCQFLLISFLCSLDDYLKDKKISVLVLVIISAFGSFIYLIANDGRNLILSVFIAILINFFYKKKIKVRTIFTLSFLLVISLFFIANMDNLTDGIRNDKEIEISLSINPFKFLNDEFGFVYMDLNNTVYLNNSNSIKYNNFDELESVLLFLVPQKFKPNDLVNLYEYNNNFYPQFFGTIPPDILTASIYLFDYPGVLIIPLIFGFIIGKIDIYFKRKIDNDKLYKNIYFLIITMLPLRICGYFDISVILFNFIFVYATLILYKIILKLKF